MTSETTTPSWLDKDFLANVLQENDLSKQINVLSYNAKPAVTAGNNYCCEVYRVHVEFERNGEPTQTSLIVKAPLSGESGGKQLIDEMGFVAKECIMYKEYLPIMKKMTNGTIVPKDYSCQITGTIILEDLKEQGYVMCDRLEQLDFDHCNIFMKTIGIFHATSLEIYNRKPELIEKVGEESVFTETVHPECKLFFLSGLTAFASVIEEWGGFEQFSKFIKINVNTIWKKAIEIHREKKHLRVLNHGDAWTNNMLFKHDDSGKVTDIKLIDLQICKFASPAVDIISFLMTSAKEDVNRDRLPELYDTYIDSFNSTLEAIGGKERLSLAQLQDELKFVEMLNLFLIPCHLAVIMNETGQLLDINHVINAWKNYEGESKEVVWKIMNKQKFKRIAKYILKKLEEQGLLESL